MPWPLRGASVAVGCQPFGALTVKALALVNSANLIPSTCLAEPPTPPVLPPFLPELTCVLLPPPCLVALDEEPTPPPTPPSPVATAAPTASIAPRAMRGRLLARARDGRGSGRVGGGGSRDGSVGGGAAVGGSPATVLAGSVGGGSDGLVGVGSAGWVTGAASPVATL